MALTMYATGGKVSAPGTVAMAVEAFSFLGSGSSSSSSTAAAEVEGLIAEAADLVALEQIATLNSAHLSDGALPLDVESRFRRLKTFPSSNKRCPQPPLPSTPPSTLERSPVRKEGSESEPALVKDAALSADDATIRPVKKDDADGLLSSLPASPVLSSSSSRGASPSPPRRPACCFGFSLKKGESRNKVLGKGGNYMGPRGRGNLGSLQPDTEMLSRSLREQQRSMRKAMEEEEKMVQRMMVRIKQASARMEVSAEVVDESLSDLE